jgi:hypothetical protein
MVHCTTSGFDTTDYNLPSFFNSEMFFDTLIDSVSGVYGFNTIGVVLANPSRTGHTLLDQ